MKDSQRKKLSVQQQARLFGPPKLTPRHYNRVREQEQAALPGTLKVQPEMTSTEIREYVRLAMVGFADRQRERERRRSMETPSPETSSLF